MTSRIAVQCSVSTNLVSRIQWKIKKNECKTSGGLPSLLMRMFLCMDGNMSQLYFSQLATRGRFTSAAIKLIILLLRTTNFNTGHKYHILCVTSLNFDILNLHIIDTNWIFRAVSGPELAFEYVRSQYTDYFWLFIIIIDYYYLFLFLHG